MRVGIAKGGNDATDQRREEKPDLALWLTIDEASKELGLSRNFIDKMIQEAKIPFLAIGNVCKLHIPQVHEYLQAVAISNMKKVDTDIKINSGRRTNVSKIST